MNTIRKRNAVLSTVIFAALVASQVAIVQNQYMCLNDPKCPPSDVEEGYPESQLIAARDSQVVDPYKSIAGRYQERNTRASAENFDLLYMLGYGSMIGFLNSIKSADVDGDSKEELVCGNKEGSIFVLERNGTGFDLEWASPLLGGNSYGLALGDVDDDSIVEIVVGAADGVVRVFGWNGNEFVLEWQSPNLGNFAYGLDIGDVDGDGAVEIVVGTGEIMFDYDTEGGWVAGTSFSPLDYNLYIFGFTGSGYHQEWSAIVPALYDGTGIYNIAIGDTDGDGFNEIVLGTFEWELLSGDFEGRYGILGWDGAGYYYEWTIREIGNWIMGMGIGDTDDDGEMEIVIAVWDDAFCVYGYDSSAPEDMYFQEWQSSDLSPFTLAVGDTDDDGIMEIVEAEEDSVNLYDFTGPGYTQVWTSGVLEEHVTGLGVGDIEGTPPNEILVGDDYTIMVQTRVGTGYIELARAEGFGRMVSLEAFDMDKDGVSELYVLSKKGTVTVLEADLDGFHIVDEIHIRDSERFTNILIRDFDGDGDMEIAVVEGNTSIKYSAGWIFRFPASSMTVSIIEYAGSSYTISDQVFIDEQGTFSAEADDVDGDLLDEVVLGGTEGDLIVVGYNGSHYVVENQTHVSEDGINGIGTGDTDGDGNLEIGICNETGSLIIMGYNGTHYVVEWEEDLPDLVIPLALDIASMDGDVHEEIFIKSAWTYDLVIQGWDGSGYSQEAILDNYDITFEECLRVDEVLPGSLQLVMGSLSAAMIEYNGGYSEIWSSMPLASNALSLEVADVDVFLGDELSLAYNGMITIYGEHLPPQAVLTASKDTLDIGEVVQFDGSDSQGKGSLEYLFDFGDGNGTGWISSPLVAHSYPEVGTYTASLTVRDLTGEKSEPVYTQVNVYAPNKIPRAIIDEITPSPAEEEEAVTFQGHGEDDDGTIVAYEWVSSRDGNLSKSGTFIAFSLSVGIHTIYFRVKDDRGDWSQADTFKLKVEKKNPLPEAEIVSISPNPALEGEQITFSGQASDDGFITSYNWESDIDGFLSSKDFFIISTLSIGEHTITFKVRDNDDAWSAPAQETLLVTELPENIPPTAVIDGISPPEHKEGEFVTFVGHGEDEDGTIVDYLWESDMDGLLSDARSFGTSDLSPGTHVITFRVKDDRGEWSNAAQTTVVVDEEEEEPPFIEFAIPEPFKDEPVLFWFLVIVLVVVILALIVLVAVRRRGKKKTRVSMQYGGRQYYGNR